MGKNGLISYLKHEESDLVIDYLVPEGKYYNDLKKSIRDESVQTLIDYTFLHNALNLTRIFNFITKGDGTISEEDIDFIYNFCKKNQNIGNKTRNELFIKKLISYTSYSPNSNLGKYLVSSLFTLNNLRLLNVLTSNKLLTFLKKALISPLYNSPLTNEDIIVLQMFNLCVNIGIVHNKSAIEQAFNKKNPFLKIEGETVTDDTKKIMQSNIKRITDKQELLRYDLLFIPFYNENIKQVINLTLNRRENEND
jgi:hypothetical protein